MKYVLGLDIGITSVGWAVLNLDEKRIEDLGIRAFNKAENPKDGSPLAEPRRIARCARRRLHRRAGRLRRAKDLFVKFGLIHENQREHIFEVLPDKSPWQLRAEGLDRKLTGEEFARALFHIIKRRGFKSNRKKVKQAEDGEILSSIGSNKQIMQEREYRTAGEMLWRDEKFHDHKRNTFDSYENSIDRATLEEEIKTLFQRQRELGNAHASSEFEQAILEVFNWQKPFASGDDILKLVGYCTFETGELRAARHSYHAERFNLLSKINNLTYSLNGDRLKLPQEERLKITAMAYDQASVTYAQIRKKLNLPDDARFSGLDYMRRPEKGAPRVESVEQAEKTDFYKLYGYHTLRKACEAAGVWDQVKSNPGMMDDLAFALSFYKTDEDITNCLTERETPPEIIEAVSGCEGFSKTIHLSTAFIKKILPHMEEGLVYSEACAKAGDDHSHPKSAEKLDKLPPISPDVTRNPVVLRALSQSRKVVNSVISRYGSPYRIHIELARDMGRSADERRKIQRQQDENRKNNEAVDEQFRSDFKREPNGTDRLKLRLYREQGGKCLYSGKSIEIERLFEPGYTELDHIIPYSRCFDDSMSNKALVLATENQKKRNRTPYEVFSAHWDEFEGLVRTIIRDPKKRNNLLRKELNEDEWKERSLQDTKYIAREFGRFVRENLIFTGDAEKQRVVCVNGRITARTRGFWGLEKAKDREKDDLHHALDAAVVATLLQHQITLITEHARIVEVGGQYVNKDTGEIIEWEQGKKPRLPQPWKGFRKELLARLSENPAEAICQLELPAYKDMKNIHPITVSRMPQRKVSGAIHEETIRSSKGANDKGKPISAVRKPLTSLSVNDLNNLYAPETNEKLYAVIRQRMAEFNNDAKKAFAEPLRKPTNDGMPGPVVKSVKVSQTQNAGVPVRGGIADNGDMIRTDVFKKDGKHYLVPVYIADKMRGELPNSAIAAGKSLEERPVMDNSYVFLFSLYPYDLIRIKTEKEDFLGYYRGSHSGDGRLKISYPNNNSEKLKEIGTRNAEVIEKFEMGVLGDYHPVRKEIRRGLNYSIPEN